MMHEENEKDEDEDEDEDEESKQFQYLWISYIIKSTYLHGKREWDITWDYSYLILHFPSQYIEMWDCDQFIVRISCITLFIWTVFC